MDVQRIATGAMVKSASIDYSAAALAVTRDHLLGVREYVPILNWLPVAYVPPVGARKLFRDMAADAANDGRVRGIFEERGPALDWAERQGRILAGLHSRIREAAL